jgi:NTE family protein
VNNFHKSAGEQPGAAGGNGKPSFGHVVLVFQGGGALGAYQAGVYQALHEAGIEPDWIVGTSIGAINASLIAGNEPDSRLQRLAEFWNRVAKKPVWDFGEAWSQFSRQGAYADTLMNGIPGFFQPSASAFFGQQYALGAERAGYYSTRPLKETLLELVDFNRINLCKPRLTVGAAHVRSSMMRYFDSQDMPICVEHVMASGALPPAFPAVRVEGELYWDGGILSNTPTEVVFEDNPRRSSLIFAVHLWNPNGDEPHSIWEVLNRHKDIMYSSRVANQIARQKQVHHLRHVIKELASRIPDAEREKEDVRELESWGCFTQMHVVRLLAPSLSGDDHTKDVDFSASGIQRRWQAGYADTLLAVKHRPWDGEFDPLDGVILHEPPYQAVGVTGKGSSSAGAARLPQAPKIKMVR